MTLSLRLCTALLLCLPFQSKADFEIELVRYQCIPEIGRIIIDTFGVPSVDEFEILLIPLSADKLRDFERKSNMLVANPGRKVSKRCIVGGIPMKITFTFTANSQGQPLGSISVETKNGKSLINKAPLISHPPSFSSLIIRAYNNCLYKECQDKYALLAEGKVLTEQKEVEVSHKLDGAPLDITTLFRLIDDKNKR